MRTSDVTRASFSVDTLRLNLPRGWRELTPDELRKVYENMIILPADGIPFAVFRLLTKIRVIRELPAGDFLCVLGKRSFAMSAEVAAEVAAELDWVMSPGNAPVRLDHYQLFKPVDAQLHGVKFGDYLTLENCYQGYLHSKSEKALRRAATILYPGCIDGELPELAVINILQWLIQVKNLFSGVFANLFKPAADGGEVSPLEIMNNEIRALTGGDVTKESTVLNTDCWRALTELDFKAKEAEDFKASIPKK